MPEQDPFIESSGLFVLGALAPADREAFETHMQGCEVCTAEVRSLSELLKALPYSVTAVEPPASLRQRILETAASVRRPAAVVPFPAQRAAAERTSAAGRPVVMWAGWLAAAASIVVASGFAYYASTLKERLSTTEVRLADAVSRLQDSDRRLQVASRETTAARGSLALLTAPDVVELRLAGQAPAPAARARAFLSRSRGLLFAATNLPSIPNDRTYQLWYLTPGAPVSAGLLRPDAQGNATVAFDVSPTTPVPTGLAVSLEPDGGVPAPTGAIYLVTQ